MKKVILGLVLWLGFCFGVVATEEHQRRSVVITEVTESSPVADNSAARSEVRAAAAGQANYKATSRIQWSIGSAFTGGESALNFGLGYQAGSVFVAAGITDNVDALFTNDSDPLITFSASGVF